MWSTTKQYDISKETAEMSEDWERERLAAGPSRGEEEKRLKPAWGGQGGAARRASVWPGTDTDWQDWQAAHQ